MVEPLSCDERAILDEAIRQANPGGVADLMQALRELSPPLAAKIQSAIDAAIYRPHQPPAEGESDG